MNMIPQQVPAEQLGSLIPHRGKMVLLSRISSHDTERNRIVAEYDVTENCILYDEELKGVPAWAGFEMMAQSISALSTIRQLSSGGAGSPAPGVILSVSGFESSVASVAAGKTVELRVCEAYRDGSVCRYDCEMYEKGAPGPVATTAITVMGIEDMNSFFEGRGVGYGN
ncbi:MAG: 3-hydroxylacyl-ACP dehydratase [Treponema sp.]|nr:3-hydroxylacyl-ACP dehydratase [Treponema sp.]